MNDLFTFENENYEFPAEYEDEAEYAEESEDEARRRQGSRSRAYGRAANYNRSFSGARSASSRKSPRRKPPRPKHPRPSGGGFPFPNYSHFSHIPPDCSDYIRLVQRLLNRALGLNLPVDGVMTVETRSALRSFQNQPGAPPPAAGDADDSPGGLAPDENEPPQKSDDKDAAQEEFDEFGFYDTESDYFEFEDEEWEGEVNRSSAEYVRWIQASLNQIMKLRLEVDGIAGTLTRSAIRSFQQQQGLTVDGVVGPVTEGALLRAGASQPPGGSGTSPYNPPPSQNAGTGSLDIVTVRGIKVARQIAAQVEGLLAAAAADGVNLSGGGYRSTEQQIQLRIAHCGGNTHYNIYEKPSSQCSPPTAPPGKSNHEKGLAIDFTYNGRIIDTHSNPGFVWLSGNAARFGLYNLPSEPWHWSVNGK